MNAKDDIAAAERLLEKKQAIPSKMIHDLIVDIKSLMTLVKTLAARNVQLENRVAELEAERVQA